MSEQPYTPTTDECRNAYLAIQQTLDGMSVLAGKDHAVRPVDSLYAEFDRWLAGVKADAWLEGYQQGYCVEPRPDWANAHENPYQQEAQR
ncbi:MAG: hypothetical protein ACI39C_07340 [Dietzia sp.]